MKRVEAEWLSFKAMVIPPDASKIQLKEMKKAFYAGAKALFELAINLSEDAADVPTEEDLIKFDEVNQELNTFLEAVKKGEV